MNSLVTPPALMIGKFHQESSENVTKLFESVTMRDLASKVKMEKAEDVAAADFEFKAKSGNTYTLTKQGWDTDFK
jgi:hypothetical protein